MSNLRPQVKAAIRTFLQTQDGYHLASDVLRVIEEEANLMKETENVCDWLERDPMEAFSKVKRQIKVLKSLIQVTSCSRVRTRKYIGIDAVVTINNDERTKLTFKYEHKPRRGVKGSHVWYSIEISNNHSQRENLLIVQVWAPGDAPCTTSPAISIRQNEEDLWEDIDDEDDENDYAEEEKETHMVSDESESVKISPKPVKKQKISNASEDQDESDHGRVDNDEISDTEETNDSYMVFLDPDQLHSFLESTNLGMENMDEITAVFLLMTFPFYDPEWDLLGYILDDVFSGDSDEEDQE